MAWRGIFHTLKMVKTVTAELKSKPKKSQDFQPQNEGRFQIPPLSKEGFREECKYHKEFN